MSTVQQAQGRRWLLGWCFLTLCVLIVIFKLHIPDVIDKVPDIATISDQVREIVISGEKYRFHEDLKLIKNLKHVRISPDSSIVEVRKQYESLFSRMSLDCRQHVRMGSMGDGGWHVCVSYPYNLRPNCLVYDFGIAGKWSFDDDISKTYECIVRAFDPTNHLEEHNRTERIHFYPIGLGGENVIWRAGNWMKTFKTILHQFGEGSSTIDYLKIDIERSEWPALKVMLQDGSLERVKQIGMEVHAKIKAPVEVITEYIDLLQALGSAGFRIWRDDWNVHTIQNFTEIGMIPQCHEIYLLNINFLRYT